MREQAHPDPALTIHLLGPVRLPGPGGDACPKGRKARALLGYLAVSPDGADTRERLADLLWTDRGPEQARGSLRQALAEIRQCAGAPMLTADRERAGLASGALRTDIDAIRAAAEARLGAELAARVDEVRGPFLDGCEGLSAAYDDWLRAERPRQHERVLSAVVDAAPDMLGRDGPATMQAIVRGLERLEPLNEGVARLGMRADHEARDLAALHRRFRRLEEGIGREFGAAPSEETRRLFARLTTAAAPAGAAGSGEAAAWAKPEPEPVARSAPPTVIVAPIEATGPGEAADLAALCTEDIRAALTRLPHLRVVALDMPDSARLEAYAGAAGMYLLSGRLRQVGPEALVTLRLGDVADQVVLWSEQLRISTADLFEAIELVVERAAGAATPSIDRDLTAKLGRAGPASSGDAALLYTEARLRIRQARTLEAATAASALLERVIELDADHVPARLLLARMLNTDFWQRVAGHDVAAFRDRADRLCREAAAIEPMNPAVLIFRAWCHLRRREWRRAELGFERASAALPYDADTTDACAFGLCHLGELDRAEPLFQRAFRLNPFPPGDYHADRAVMLALRGDGEEAEEHFEVSGEHGLQYLAVRLANLWRFGGNIDRLREAFIRGFGEAWRPARPPEPEDILTWLDHTLPLRRAEHREFVRDGLASALAGAWRPAAAGENPSVAADCGPERARGEAPAAPAPPAARPAA